MMPEPDYRPVLAAYPSWHHPRQARYLGSAGGFSGACFWQLQTDAGLFCLRRWPAEHPTADRLEFIQAVLWHVNQMGFRLAAMPVETLRRRGYVSHAGHLWDLTPWLPGRADYAAQPHPKKLIAAMQTLAEFHRAAEEFPLPHPQQLAAPGIVRRLEQLQGWVERGMQELSPALQSSVWPELEPRARRVLAGNQRLAEEVLRTLQRAALRMVEVQPCIRDVWHDHVLFVGHEVTGLIDFGAMQPDNVATDVARLLGSLTANDAAQWQLGLEAYEQVRPLSHDEHELLQAFDQSGVLLSGLNWLRWVYLEGRRFERPEAVLERLDACLQRLEHLAQVA